MAKKNNKDIPKTTEKTLEKKTTKKAIKSIPSMPFEDVLHLSQAIWECSSGTRVRKITLFDQYRCHLHCQRHQWIADRISH